MLFNDILISKQKEQLSEFGLLLKKAFSSQSHTGDLLLIFINGFYDEKIKGTTIADGKKASPFLIGPGLSGHSDETHYRFIHEYRKKVERINYSDYVKLHVYDPNTSEQRDKLLLLEENTIHLETLVYLKIWEGDHFLKNLYQFVRILNSDSYDWFFKLKDHKSEVGTATRPDLIRLKIRDKLSPHSIYAYELIKGTYITQVRNAIAHSNFSFLGRNIHLHNFSKNDPFNNRPRLTFDEWVDIFHNTIILHNSYIWLKNEINSYYAKIYRESGRPIEIRLTDNEGKESFSYVEYVDRINDWRFYR